MVTAIGVFIVLMFVLNIFFKAKKISDDVSRPRKEQEYNEAKKEQDRDEEAISGADFIGRTYRESIDWSEIPGDVTIVSEGILRSLSLDPALVPEFIAMSSPPNIVKEFSTRDEHGNYIIPIKLKSTDPLDIERFSMAIYLFGIQAIAIKNAREQNPFSN